MNIFKAIFGKKGGSVRVGGRNYVGRNITISGGSVVIDGVVHGHLEVDNHVIKVEVYGDVEELSTVSGDIVVHGDVSGNVENVSGDVHCKNVGRNVETTSGDVKCHDVQGEVSTTSGDITQVFGK